MAPSDDDNDINVGRTFTIFGIVLAILFGTFATLTLLVHFNVFRGIREKLNSPEETKKAKGLKSLYQYQQFLFNLSTRFYVGAAYLYPSGFCGMPPGAFEDLARIVANKHTFFSIVLCDENNLFKPFERNVNYFIVASLGYVMFAISVALSNLGDNTDPQAQTAILIFWNVFVTNIVMTLMSEISYYLLSCPCCHRYGNRTELRTVINVVEYMIAGIFILVGVAFLFFGSLFIQLGLPDTQYEDQIKFICWQYVVTLFVQWFQELFTFCLMFVDISSGTCSGIFFKHLKSLTCGFMGIGEWVRTYLYMKIL